MINLEAQPERKLLGAEAWLDLPEEVRVKFDYPSESQEVELRRLQMLWFGKMASPLTDHWLSYYLRATIRDVQGITVAGKPTQLVIEKGLAKNLKSDGGELDLIAAFIQLDVLETVASMIRQRLEVTELDKKKLQSSLTLSSRENSNPITSSSSPVQESSTAGNP